MLPVSTRSVSGRWRRLTAVGVASALALSVLSGTAFGATTTPTPSDSRLTAGSQAAAEAQARSTGKPVEVTDETTETQQVMAQPNGTFTLTSTLTPVRVKQNGVWRGIDTTLRTNADGTVAPIAAAEDVRFSGGGSQPAITLAAAGNSLSFSWPAPLPQPVLSGSTASYPSVLPGVDLVLTALPSAYTEVLVVHDSAAAANPALRQLRFTVASHGLKVGPDGQGGLTATDGSGAQIFHGSQPVMWDATADPGSGRAPTASRPGPGALTRLPLSLPALDGTRTARIGAPSMATMTLVPPAAKLTGPGVRYPVYIDPSLAPYRAHFAVVTTNGGWHYYDDTSNDLKVGDCDWSGCNGVWTARTYLAFDTGALGGKATTAKVYSAEVDVYEIHNAGGCTDEPVDLYSANSISSSTTWPGPIVSELDETPSHLGDTCNSSAGDVVFNGTNVTNKFQSAASGDWSTVTFGLRSPDEGDPYQWKRFSSAGSGGAAAQIVVNYDFPPSTPYSLSLDNTVKCSGLPTYTRDNTPTLHAAATDYNTPHVNIGMFFEVYNSADTTRYRYNPTGVTVASGALASWSTNSSNSNSTAALGDGAYDFRAHATAISSNTADAASGDSGWVPFTIDTTAPAVPVISSHDYPYQAWGTQSGAGTVTFNGSSDTAGFGYSIDSSGTELLPADTTCAYTKTPTASGGMITADSAGDATVTLPALTPGYHTLYVKAFDDAHNVSNQTAAWIFYVSPTYANEGTTKYEVENLPQPTQPPGQSVPAYLHDSTSWYSGGTGVQIVPTGPASLTYQIVGAAGVPFEADYAIGVELQQATHYGKVTFAIDGQPVKLNGTLVTVDTYSATVQNIYVSLGGLHLVPGTPHFLTVNIVGTSAPSGYNYNGAYGRAANGYPVQNFTNYNDNGYTVVLDDVRVVPINNATYGSINSAMNNNGITADTGPQADFGPSRSYRALSSSALASAGFGAGSTVTVDSGTVDQTTFTMPAYNTSTDNVIATGQTIPLPADTTASYVDLLVASTCGGTQYDASIQATINFDDGTYSQVQLPAVPDWINGTLGAPASGQQADITLAATLDHSLVGTTVDSTNKPKLYHVALPTQWTGSPVHSITLPYLGSDLTQRCNVANLHVLAIGTH